MIDFRTLETFWWVVTLGSFNGAAVKLGTTQPAVSQRIALLEQDFGVQLIVRDRRNVVPTAPGRKLMSYAERVMSMKTEMLTTISNPKAIGGVLRLGVTETIVHSWLPDLIRRVSYVYPNLDLEIQSDITFTMRTKLLNQELDLAFVMGPLNDSVLENRFLCDYPVAFIASPRLKVPKPATVSDLAQFRIMTFPRKTQPYEVLRTIFNESNLPPVRIHSSNALMTLVPLALEGLGVIVVPPIIVEKQLRSGELEIIPTVDAEIPDVSFTATWMNSPDSMASELVADLAVELARQSTKKKK
ncbi:LysR family transcriptional regulator [Brucella pituitosa]|uniref:LysR family transcriptional regulator n=1 Tax=Brucella pituitosa TaxID=571256 RepID=UPI003F4ABB0A